MTKEFDERNMAKSRRVCEDMEAAHVTKWLKLTERERQILDMWPRFEDGACVWLGDSFADEKGELREIEEITLYSHGIDLYDAEGFHKPLGVGERVKRPVQSVLDADGVEIKLGDTVWHCIGIYDELAVEEIDDESGWVRTRSANGACLSAYHTHLTHTRPDSWELLEEDASKDACMYFGTKYFNCGECPADGANCFGRMKSDLIRRAKALAGVWVD